MNELVEVKEHTKKQLVFLDALFGEANGDIDEAKKIAEYSINYRNSELVNLLKDEILQRASMTLAFTTPKAVLSLINVMEDPVQPAARERLTAIREILDRAGLAKKEDSTGNTNIENMNILILPEKRKVIDVEDTEIQMAK